MFTELSIITAVTILTEVTHPILMFRTVAPLKQIQAESEAICLINNQGTTTFTNTGTIQFRDSFSFYNMGAKSKLIATAPSMIVFGTNNIIENSGVMEFSSLENADAKRFKNEASGVINISRYFYNHGAILNDGEINTLCGSFGSSACQFIIGDKGAGKEFQNNGCMTVTGDVNIRGAAFINGTLTINNGNLTIDKKISGNGRSHCGYQWCKYDQQ